VLPDLSFVGDGSKYGELEVASSYSEVQSNWIKQDPQEARQEAWKSSTWQVSHMQQLYRHLRRALIKMCCVEVQLLRQQSTISEDEWRRLH
jgi:hypothetical protein